HMGAGRTYLFLDEIQRVEGWHDVVNSLRVGFDCDIYLTGSNAFLLSGELATYLSGRYVEVKMLPLSFREYANFCGLHPAEGNSIMLREGGDPVLADDLVMRYLRFGGMPAIASLSTTQAQHEMYLSSLYETVVVRDIFDRERNATERAIRNPDVLRLVCEFLADNVGNTMSANSMASALSQVTKITDKTVAAYMKALNDAYAFYPAKRYDLHGKAVLRTLPKQYIVDTGLRSYLMGYRDSDVGRVFENSVYLQLVHDGWSVHVGKLYQKEVDFVCLREGEVLYVQVADSMADEATRERELAPLRAITDNHPKWIIVRQGSYPSDVDGIRIVRAADFFLRAEG
ncbi:MAG: ATP-binding protein, partial [Eggerthellaceae bacterium]|nr:ATP-binding protein [Eggerthellaceae bacterium]